jgi:hypothetical protein
LETKIILLLIDVLLLSLLNILALINILLQQLVLSSELLIILAHLVNISVVCIDLRITGFNFSLGELDLVIDTNAFLFTIKDISL